MTSLADKVDCFVFYFIT